MIVASLTELKLFPVAHRGVPNSEHIPIQVLKTVNMSQFGLLVGISNYDTSATPVQDNLFWFGGGVVNTGDWIFVYTGSGTPRTDDWSNPPGSKIYTVHWGRPTTMFANSAVVPMLISIDAVEIGAPAGDVPQLTLPSS